jgi:hypothetical protein
MGGENMNGPVIRIPKSADASKIIDEMIAAFEKGAAGVALDLCEQDFEDPRTEDLLLELEANFAMQQRKISVIIATPGDPSHLKQQRDQMAKLIGASTVITGVAIEGARDGVESLKRFLKEKLYATMPISAEIT